MRRAVSRTSVVMAAGLLSCGGGSVVGGMEERRRLGTELVVDGRRVASETR